MNEDRIAMSQKERDTLKIMTPVLAGKRTQVQAARLLRRSTRQIRRLQRRLESCGDGGVIHRLRGQPSNNCKDNAFRRQAVDLYRRDYPDFGPTLAAEELAKHGLDVCPETLRLWLKSAGLWKPKRRRQKHRRRRERRECFGELVQADGSPHDWLEGRGPRMDLLVMIDDATSKVVARFYPGETTEGYMDLTKRYLRKHGRPVALYTDRNSIFWGETKARQPVETQFTRALKQLDIGWIAAYSPQAKGRVERFNATAQDRLVKQLRLAGACTMAEANAVLNETFLPWFNRRCTVKPASGNDAHRPAGRSVNTSGVLSIHHVRTVANDYTIRLDNVFYQLLPPAWPGLRGGKVVVENRLDGSVRIRFGDRYLKYEILGEAQPPGALPPDPRGLSHQRCPAEKQRLAEKQSLAEKDKGDASAPPSAGSSTIRRSGCSSAEPCPSDDKQESIKRQAYRPSPAHPWRRSMKKRKKKKFIA